MTVAASLFTPEMEARLGDLLTTFKLPTLSIHLAERLLKAGKADALAVVLEVCELEAQDRHGRRVDRLRKASDLPPGKTFETFKDRVPKPLMNRMRELGRGDFLERAANVLMFGLPGVGKSHAAAAIGHALVDQGHSVLFAPAYKVVQDLLAAKRDLALPRALRRLDIFDLLILDDIGYVQQSPEEAEVLFTMMAERYERRSLLITSNLVFSEWDRIFKNPMTTAAAIDRVVHHSVILEFAGVPSYRGEEAKERTPRTDGAPSTKAKRGDRAEAPL
jgi:DNA replication protein DnaC